jgi:hypothetical protein
VGFSGSGLKGVYLRCSDDEFNRKLEVPKHFDEQNYRWTRASSTLISVLPETNTSSDRSSNITVAPSSSQATTEFVTQRRLLKKKGIIKLQQKQEKLSIDVDLKSVRKNGNIPNKKEMKEACTCLKLCSEKVANATRNKIFNHFWELGSRSRKREFIVRHVSKIDIKRVRVENSRRTCTLQYNLPVENSGGGLMLVKVCKKMFLNTLSISEKYVRTALHKVLRGTIEGGRRGKHLKRHLIFSSIK